MRRDASQQYAKNSWFYSVALGPKANKCIAARRFSAKDLIGAIGEAVGGNCQWKPIVSGEVCGELREYAPVVGPRGLQDQVRADSEPHDPKSGRWDRDDRSAETVVDALI